LKESKNTSGARRKTHGPVNTAIKNTPTVPIANAQIARSKVGCFAPTSRAATHTGAENTTTNPTNATMAGKPVSVRFKFAPFCLLGIAVEWRA
jgi:hypothetical protein